MPNKTIYVKDSDLEVFEKAEKLGGENLSATIAEALRRFVAAEEARQKGYQEVELEVGLWPDKGDDDTRKVKFFGRLLAEGRQYTGQLGSRDDRGIDYKLYQTKAGKIVIHWERWSRWQGEATRADYQVLPNLPGYDQEVFGRIYDDIDDVVYIPGNLLQEAAEELGQELAEWIE